MHLRAGTMPMSTIGIVGILHGGLAKACRNADVRGECLTTTPSRERLHPIQQCFLEKGGAQCGICTPGMILATHHLLDKYPRPTLEQIQEGLAGNLCRCTGYMRIFDAVEHAVAEHVTDGVTE